MRLCALLLTLLWAALAQAHPLGNNTVNRAAALALSGDGIRIDYRLDLAEIPTLLASQSADSDGDGLVTDSEWRNYAHDAIATRLPALHLHAGQRALALRMDSVGWRLADGAAGLNQLQLHAVLHADAPGAGPATLSYADRSRPAEVGWREVWVTAEGGARIVATRAARVDRSHALSRFPAPGGPLLNEATARMDVEFAGSGMPAANYPPQPAGNANGARAEGPLALFLLGVHHIASGWDHLVFLLGLVLLCPGLRRLLAVVSAFTVAHSLTLGLAAAGLVTPPGALVEPAIALSIAYVGLCNVLQRQRAHGVLLAFAFGLIHGFGFAGALAASMGTEVLDGHGWLFSLAAFNLGIESFQVALLCVVVPLAAWAARWSWTRFARRGAAHAVLWSGLTWLALRVIGP